MLAVSSTATSGGGAVVVVGTGAAVVGVVGGGAVVAGPDRVDQQELDRRPAKPDDHHQSEHGQRGVERPAE